MSRSIIKLTSVVLVIAALLFVALNGIDFSDKVRIPGILDTEDTTGVKGIVQGLDLKGGSVIVLEAAVDNPTGDQMDTVASMMRTRLDNLGYTEANVSIQGTNQVRIEIPDLENPEEAANVLGAAAQLQFIAPISSTPAEVAPVEPTEDATTAETDATAETTEADVATEAPEEAPADLATALGGSVVLTGNDIKNASAKYEAVDEMGTMQHFVELELTAEGVQKFASATAKVATLPKGENVIYIAMDNAIISAPQVEQEINSDTCTIQGDFTAEETKTLAAQIRSGQLPFSLIEAEVSSISATLGQTALQTALTAGMIGLLLVMLFMLLVYRLPGLLADISLLAYMAIVGIILANAHVNLTLPGIAGIILSIGMAVDANVVIFERIKEELRNGKTVRSAVDSGFKRALSAVIDSNITTIIAAAILMWLGTGTIKGFGTTLLIGVVVSMISAIFITKFLLKQMIGMNVKNVWYYGINKKKEDAKNA